MRTTQDVRGERVFDSRDAIARRDELKSNREDLVAALEELETSEREAAGTLGIDYVPSVDVENAQSAVADWDAGDEAEELRDLEAFLEDVEGYVSDGESFIADSYFEDYARELAEDIGALENCDHWPATCIDWERATRELQFDYSSAELAGETYWYRS